MVSKDRITVDEVAEVVNAMGLNYVMKLGSIPTMNSRESSRMTVKKLIEGLKAI